MMQWEHESLRSSRCDGRPRGERLGCRDAVHAIPVEHGGHRQFVAKRDFEGVTAFEPKITIWRLALKRPYRCFRLILAQRDAPALCLQHQGAAPPLGGGGRSQGWAEDASAQSGHKLAAVQPEN